MKKVVFIIAAICLGFVTVINGNGVGTTKSTTVAGEEVTTTPEPWSYTICTFNRNLCSKAQYEAFLTKTLTGPTATYNMLVPPIASVSDYPIAVNVSFKLLQVIDFNEVAGTLELVGFLTVVWTDQLIDDSFDEIDHGSLTKFLVPENRVWKPPLSIFNSVDSINPISDSSYKVRVEMGYKTCVTNSSNGISTVRRRDEPAMTWKPGINSKTTCALNVKDFPFDSQECTIRIISFGYPSNEVQFFATNDEVDITEYQTNAEWVLDSTFVEVQEVDSSSIIYITFKFTRRPTYFIVNLIAPILILAVISTLVFFLPGNSGERVGYSVTAFLTFAVYLTMVSDILPKTSEPMSTLCYFLMCMVIISAGTALSTIFTLRIFHKDEKKPVPNWLANFIGCLNCRICGQDEFEDPEFSMIDMKKRKIDTRSIVTTDSDDEPERKWGVDWKLVAATLDMLFFLVFLGCNAAVVVIFLIPLLAKMDFSSL